MINKKKRDISIEYQCEVERVLSKEEYEKQVDTKSESWPPVYVKLTNGKIFGCDFVISATGVKPSTEVFTKNNNVSDLMKYHRKNL
jgi:NAD(P)H-nitrite reductase large subunit